MVKYILLIDFLPLKLFNDVISDLNNFVSIVDMPLNKVVQVGLESAYQFFVKYLHSVKYFLTVGVKNDNELVTFVFHVFLASQNKQPLASVINSKV